MAMIGKVKSVNIVGSPVPGDALKLRVIYDASIPDASPVNPWTIGVVAYNGTVLGWDNTTHFSSVTDYSVEFTLNIKLPSTSKNMTILLYGHPDGYQKIEQYVTEEEYL